MRARQVGTHPPPGPPRADSPGSSSEARGKACPGDLPPFQSGAEHLASMNAPSMTSTGSLNLSKAPFFNRSLLRVTWPGGHTLNVNLALRMRSRTLSDTVVNLVHVQIFDIWGQNAVEQLSLGLRKSVVTRGRVHARCSTPPSLGPTTRPCWNGYLIRLGSAVKVYHTASRRSGCGCGR